MPFGTLRISKPLAKTKKLGKLKIGYKLFNLFNIPLLKKTISGKYVNEHYDVIHAHHEIASKPDTLTLKPDGTLYSEFYGKGTYIISYSGDLTQKIVLKPENPKEAMTFSTYIYPIKYMKRLK